MRKDLYDIWTSQLADHQSKAESLPWEAYGDSMTPLETALEELADWIELYNDLEGNLWYMMLVETDKVRGSGSGDRLTQRELDFSIGQFFGQFSEKSRPMEMDAYISAWLCNLPVLDFRKMSFTLAFAMDQDDLTKEQMGQYLNSWGEDSCGVFVPYLDDCQESPGWEHEFGRYANHEVLGAYGAKHWLTVLHFMKLIGVEVANA